VAGDWIKMRSDLFTHPKVVRIASALKADKLRTVGGLMSVWCLFDAHSADGTLDGYSGETLDDHLSWPGFSAAMSAVGWLSIEPESLVLPEFETHNGASAKRRAQDADRKKAVRKASACDADKMRTREEKRREEKKEPPTTPSAAFDMFPGVSAEVLADFTKLRTRKRAPITATAAKGIIREAAAAGMTLQQALETCCQRGWTGFEAKWVNGQGFNGHAATPPSRPRREL